MNKYKREEVALYITFAIFLVAIGLMSGDYIKYLAMLGISASITGSGFVIHKLVSLALQKLFPEKQIEKQR